MALLGAIAMGGGYYIAIVTENPIKATMLFFVAVILVIIGTYLPVHRRLHRRAEGCCARTRSTTTGPTTSSPSRA